MTLPQTIISHSTADFNTRDGVATEHALARGYGLSRAFTHKTLKKIKDGVPDLGWGEPTWALVKGGPDKGGVEEALWLFDDAIIEIFSSYGGQCGVLVRCDDAAVAEPYIARFVEIFPTHTDPEPEEDNKVRFTFSILQEGGDNPGPRSFHKDLKITPWPAAAELYPSSVLEDLASLVEVNEDSIEEVNGRLILWHGPPGTGKTSAIRSLARTWRDWADFHYIVDPEKLFGNAMYLTQVMLDCAADDGYRVLVIEDADEFLRPKYEQSKKGKAKKRASNSQALGRLLNLTDGILGQGAKLLILITTNEDVKEFHPALMRPGRLLTNMEFPAFDEPEANKLFAHLGVDAEATCPLTLAEVFGVKSALEEKKRAEQAASPEAAAIAAVKATTLSSTA